MVASELLAFLLSLAGQTLLGCQKQACETDSPGFASNYSDVLWQQAWGFTVPYATVQKMRTVRC